MATFDFTLTDADAGRVLDPANGFLVNLSRTKAPTSYQVGQATPFGEWTHGSYFQLRGSEDHRDLFCTDMAGFIPMRIGKEFILALNASIPFKGSLKVVAVPRGSDWTLTLSDVENVRTPPPPGSKGVPYGRNRAA